MPLVHFLENGMFGFGGALIPVNARARLLSGMINVRELFFSQIIFAHWAHENGV
jgi:hypothetical protein